MATNPPADRLPQPKASPCFDCPWRRDAQPGWLGPATADEWVKTAQSDSPILCHLTIVNSDDGYADWDDPDLRQCAGAAIFRNNVCKLPRHPCDAAHDFTADRDTVFGWYDEFTTHHNGGPRG